MIVPRGLLRLITALSIVAVVYQSALGLTVGQEGAESTLGRVHFWLTLLHNNDGESQLINAGPNLEDFGGVGRFATLVRQLKQTAAKNPRHSSSIVSVLSVRSSWSPQGIISWLAPSSIPASRKVSPLMASTIIGTTEVPLDGLRTSVRTKESNEGNLVADALLSQAKGLAEQFGAPMPNVALQNGGGIRNNTIIPVGNITELTTFEILPFANFVTIVPDIPPT